MSYLTDEIENHDEITKDRLKFQFKDSPNVLSFTEILTDQIQDLEDAFNGLLTKRDIENSTGQQLDGIGEIVGIERQGLDDDEYRLRIYFQIARNTSEGTIEDLINTLRILTGAEQVIVQEYFPASVTAMVGKSIPADLGDTTLVLIQDVVSAGVRVDSIGTFDEENYFSYIGSVSDGSNGYGDINDANIGGKYASLL